MILFKPFSIFYANSSTSFSVTNNNFSRNTIFLIYFFQKFSIVNEEEMWKNVCEEKVNISCEQYIFIVIFLSSYNQSTGKCILFGCI